MVITWCLERLLFGFCTFGTVTLPIISSLEIPPLREAKINKHLLGIIVDLTQVKDG